MYETHPIIHQSTTTKSKNPKKKHGIPIKGSNRVIKTNKDFDDDEQEELRMAKSVMCSCLCFPPKTRYM